jgi:hypothetical protein
MRCEVVRLRLLSTLDPTQPPDELRAHLADCEFCRDWHNDLCLFERNIQYLPVPRTRGKARLLERLLNAHDKSNTSSVSVRDTAVTLPESTTVTVVDSPALPQGDSSDSPAPPRPRLLSFQGLMSGLAAVILFVLGCCLRRQ